MYVYRSKGTHNSQFYTFTIAVVFAGVSHKSLMAGTDARQQILSGSQPIAPAVWPV
jgi:hypothetical protein